MSLKKRFQPMVQGGLLVLAGIAVGCGDLRPTDSPVRRVAYKNNGEIAVFLSQSLVTMDRTLSVETGSVSFVPPPAGGKIVLERLSADGSVAVVAWSDDPNWSAYPRATSIPLTVEAVRMPDRELLLRLDLPSLDTLELSPAGDRLAIHVPNFNDASPVRALVYDLNTGGLLWSSPAVFPPFAFSPDGNTLYGSVPSPASHALGAFDASTGVERYVQPYSEPFMPRFAMSPDGARLIGTSGIDPTADNRFASFSIHRTSDGQLEQTILQVPYCDQALEIAISPDGEHWASITQYLLNSLGPIIQMWTMTGTLLYTLPPARARTLAFSPDGQELVATPESASEASGVAVYRVSDGTLRATRAFPSDIF